jgi:hypothetical protein
VRKVLRVLEVKPAERRLGEAAGERRPPDLVYIGIPKNRVILERAGR